MAPSITDRLLLWGVTSSHSEGAEVETRTWGGFELAWFAARDPQKERSEDAAAAVLTSDGRLGVCVLDGMGGMIDGEAAARIGAQEVTSSLERDPGCLRSCLVDAYERAGAKILAEHPGAAATAVAAWLSGEQCQTVHAGDAEGLHFSPDGGLLHRTLSHSPVSYAQACGVLTEAEAMAHPERHLVGSGLGVDAMTMRIGPRSTFHTGDTLLLASDGLTDNVFTTEIAEALARPSLNDAIEHLAALANQRMANPVPGPDGYLIGKPDDLTILAVRPRASSVPG